MLLAFHVFTVICLLCLKYEVHGMKEKVRLFLPAAFNQTKMGEQLSSLRHSQQCVEIFQALNQSQGI